MLIQEQLDLDKLSKKAGFGNTCMELPPIIFGTSCLGNLAISSARLSWLRSSRNATPLDFQAVADYLAKNEFPIERVVTEEVPLKDALSP